RSSVSAAGERPEALRPCRVVPSQTIANRSEPMSLEPGCTTASVIAVATAASTAFPPRRSTASPAPAASGWLVATAPRGAYNAGLFILVFIGPTPHGRPSARPHRSRSWRGDRDEPVLLAGDPGAAGQRNRALAMPVGNQRIQGIDVRRSQRRARGAQP